MLRVAVDPDDIGVSSALRVADARSNRPADAKPLGKREPSNAKSGQQLGGAISRPVVHDQNVPPRHDPREIGDDAREVGSLVICWHHRKETEVALCARPVPAVPGFVRAAASSAPGLVLV